MSILELDPFNMYDGSGFATRTCPLEITWGDRSSTMKVFGLIKTMHMK